MIMAMTRKEINDEISIRQEQISVLKSELSRINEEIFELKKKACQTSDENQWYVEEDVEIILSRRPKRTEKRRMGYVCWRESFPDDGNGTVTIDRRRCVRENGVWNYNNVMGL